MKTQVKAKSKAVAKPKPKVAVKPRAAKVAKAEVVKPKRGRPVSNARKAIKRPILDAKDDGFSSAQFSMSEIMFPYATCDFKSLDDETVRSINLAADTSGSVARAWAKRAAFLIGIKQSRITKARAQK